VRPFAAAGYAVVARYRYRLPGGTDACRVPPGSAKHL
jgi:predicted DCC family thiol-disulfide oxidoreductase YuxK